MIKCKGTSFLFNNVIDTEKGQSLSGASFRARYVSLLMTWLINIMSKNVSTIVCRDGIGRVSLAVRLCGISDFRSPSIIAPIF